MIRLCGDVRPLSIKRNQVQTLRRCCSELPEHRRGGAAFEIFSAVTPNKLGTVSAPITFESDREARVGKIGIPGVGERGSSLSRT
jgi:hypothetical protein